MGVFGSAVQTLDLVVLVDDRDTLSIVSRNNATDTPNRSSFGRLNGHDELLEQRLKSDYEMGAGGEKGTHSTGRIEAIYSSRTCCEASLSSADSIAAAAWGSSRRDCAACAVVVERVWGRTPGQVGATPPQTPLRLTDTELTIRFPDCHIFWTLFFRRYFFFSPTKGEPYEVNRDGFSASLMMSMEQRLARNE